MKLKIKELCEERGLTQKQLAEMSGISEAGLSNAIKGNPKADTLEKIAKALDVGINDLFAEKVHKVLCKGELRFGDIAIPCYVLEDGTRVFSGRGIQKAIGAKSPSGSWLSRFIDSAPIRGQLMQIPAGNTTAYERIKSPIKIERNNAGGSQSMTYGYEATLFVDLCDAIIRAGENGDEIPKPFIVFSNLLMRSVAKTGIIALIDEATGYQYEREKSELQKILKAYISEELLAWEKRFPDEFYKEIFRLNGWGYLTVNGINSRPSIIGKWTKKYIYSALPHGVLRALLNVSERNDKGKLKHKLHQHLTREQGVEHLNRQIISVVTLMNISDSWKEFDRLWNRKFGQQELPFKEQEELIDPK